MENKNRYIAVGWYSERCNQNVEIGILNRYIIFDSITYEVKVVSDKALKLMNNQLLNIDYDEYINHLTPIIRFMPKHSGIRFRDIDIKHEIKEEKGHKYTVIEIHNISNHIIQTNKFIDKYLIVTNKQDEDTIALYSGYIIDGKYEDDGTYVITIKKKVGYDHYSRDKNSADKVENFMFKRGFLRVNSNSNVNLQLKQRDDKLKLLGKEAIEYEYIEDDGIWLLSMGLEHSDNIQIPICMDYISYNFTNDLLKLVSGTKRKVTVYLSESQIQSIRYNVSLMPLECTFGKKIISRDEIINQLNKAVENNRLVVRLK